MERLNDLQLVERCLEGDREAFGVIVERYQTPVYNAAMRILQNANDAEDIAQVVFLKAFERLDSFDSRYRVFSWIYRIAINESLNARNQRRQHEEIADLSTDEPPGKALDERDAVDRALSMLQPEERAIVILKHMDGFSYRDIGFIMDWSEGTVKSRLYEARQRLKEILTTLDTTVSPIERHDQ